MAEGVVPSLKSIALSLLRPVWHTVNDVGDAGFGLVKDLLAAATAPQLLQIEENSPHLIADTEGELFQPLPSSRRRLTPLAEALWKELAIKDFVKVRIAVEDGTMTREPKSWRALHEAETVKQQVSPHLRAFVRRSLTLIRYQERMEAVLQKMRGAYKSHTEDRKTSMHVDGVMMAKRRKLNSMVSGASESVSGTLRVLSSSPLSLTARPKTLIEKARVNSRKIGTIYAPKRRRGLPVRSPSPPPPPPALPASTMISSRSGNKPPPPRIQTVTRTVKVAAPLRPPPPASTSKMSLPPASSPTSTSAPRQIASISSRRPSAASPPPPRPIGNTALSPPPPPPPRPAPPFNPNGIRPSAKALNSLFLKRKR